MSQISTNNVQIPKVAWLIWGLGAFFYFAQYAIRLVPSVIQAELTLTFDMSAASLGYLGGLFYYPYIAMQMPIGTLVDRFGARTLLALGALFCGLSAYLFAYADTLFLVYLSRFLLGLFASAGFVCALKLATQWFPASMLGLMIGVTQTFGMLGASSGGPISLLNRSYSYPTILYGMGTIFLILALLSYFLAGVRPPQTRPQSQSASEHPVMGDILKTVLFNRYTWINALYAGLIYAPVQVLGEYWGAKFFSSVHDITLPQGAFAAGMLFIGAIIGAPFAGLLADKIGRRPVMLISAASCTVLFSLLFLLPALPFLVLVGFCLLVGTLNTGLIAAYTASGELHETRCAGLSMAIANMFSIGIGAILIQVCGVLLDAVTQGQLNAFSEPVYTPQECLVSFSVLPLCSFCALICAFFMKETYKKNEKRIDVE